MGKYSINIRQQLLIAMSFFTVVGLIIAFTSMYFINKIHTIYKVSDHMQGVYKNYSNTVSFEQKFFQSEINRSYFYETGRSIYVNSFKKNISKTLSELDALKQQNAFDKFDIQREVLLLITELSSYEVNFLLVIEKLKIKGFKNLGLEGIMSNCVLELERKSKEIGLEHILMLRRYEKDYLLKNEVEYVNKLNKEVAVTKLLLINDDEIRLSQKDSLVAILTNYQNAFNNLAKIRSEIGYKENKSLNELLTLSKNSIENHFSFIQNRTESQAKILVRNLQIGFVFVVVNIIALSVFLIILYSRIYNKINKRIEKIGLKPLEVVHTY